MLKRKLRLEIALPIVLAFAAMAFMEVNHQADAATQTPKSVWGDTQCLKCHTDIGTIKKMQWKKDDPSFCQAAYEKIQKDEKLGKASNAKNWSGSYPSK